MSRAVLDCGNLWKDVTKKIRKRRAMVDLLKYLESSGLSRHMSKLIEVLMTESPCSLFLLFPILLVSIVDRSSYDNRINWTLAGCISRRI